MHVREIAGAAGLWCALAAPAQAQAPADAPIELGEPIRDTQAGVEFRVPKGAKRAAGNDLFQHLFEHSIDGADGRIFVAAMDPPEGAAMLPIDVFVDTTKEVFVSRGGTVTEHETGFDPKTGSVARLRCTIGDGQSARAAAVELYYYTTDNRVSMVGVEYERAGAAVWRRVARAVMFSFRIIWVPDDRLEAPANAERTDTDTFTFLVGKGAAAGAKKVQDDCVAALAFARSLTGGPALPTRLLVHVHADGARLKKVAAGGATVPAACYVPQGRLVLASAGAGALADRCEAVLDAYLDAWLGTPFGRPPWLALGLRECVRAPKAGKDGLAADVGASRHAAWLRKNARKASWLPARAFLQAPPAEFATDKPERATYAMGLLLAAARSADEPTRTVVPRFCAEFLRHRDPDLALDDVLKGVDLDALDKATRDLLAKG